MKAERFLSLFILIGALVTSAVGVTINETLDATVPAANPAYRAVTGLQTGRLNRFLPTSSCGSLKANPGINPASGSRQYDEYGFVALSSGCVTVTLSNAGNDLLFSTAYNHLGINTSNPSLNYLADAARSPITSVPVRTFSFNVIAGQVFHVVVHEVNVGGGIGQSYTLDVSGVKLIPDFTASEVLDTITPQADPAVVVSATGNQTGRISRNGVSSSCTSPKSNPGLLSPTGARRTDLFRFTPWFSGCAAVSISHTGVHQAHAVAYDQNGFVASNPSINYLADAGSSAVNNQVTFSFIVTRGVPFDIAIHEVNAGAGIGDSYTLNVSNVKLAPTIQINSKMDPLPPAIHQDYGSITGLQTGRLFRGGTASTCAAPKPNPGLASATGARQFDLFTITPVVSGCVAVTLKGNVSIFSVAYNAAGFSPVNPSTNYLADGGSSPSPGAPRTYSFSVIAGQPFHLTVHEVNPGGAFGLDYQLEIKGVAVTATAHAAPFDFDGDNRTDVSIFRPGPGEWWYLRSIDGGNNAFTFGQSTDITVPADFTGDTKTDIAIWRPGTGDWFVLRSEDQSFYSFPFGSAGDIPAPGDFDGDGKADAAVFRPSTATWFISRSTDGGTTIDTFGATGDKPVVADYDGDGYDDIAIYRPSLSQWWLKRSDQGTIAFQFGAAGDMTVQGDHTGDGKADVAFWRPSNGNWFVLRSEDQSFFSFPFGAGGDVPAPGDYDGDGEIDATVFRPSTNTWFSFQTTNGTVITTFGAGGDAPVPNSYVFQ